VQVRACNKDAKLGLAEVPMLFLEFHGTEATVKEQSERFGEVVREYTASPFEWATHPEDRSRLWNARHHVYWANKSFLPGADLIVTDVCVPISRLAECVTETKEDVERTGLVAPIVGHVGDGNFHCSVLIMQDDADEVARATGFVERLVERALAMEGPCTGEHAIGQGKMRYLVSELGDVAVNSMREVKRALDPHGLMNPGKVV
jgi:D-lactate dehydrogenase (cytochrome)